MALRVFYTDEVYVDYEDVLAFDFHKDFLIITTEDSQYWINQDKINGFSVSE